MTAIGKPVNRGQTHPGCTYVAIGKDFSNGRRLWWCNKCGWIDWEDVPPNG